MRARRMRGRELDGVLLLDKRPGLTSNAALQEVKRLFNARKAGHTGSLDPLASGLLPICLGEATKLSGFLLNTDKRYRVVMQLGVRTATGDAEGEILERLAVPSLDENMLETVLARFRGEISQIPPMYSALKHQGQRLYDLARQGVEVPREPRQITIHELRLLSREAERLSVDVHCSKGTYIRTLAEDIGAALGCGAHVVELRRTGVGAFDLAGAHTIERLSELDETARDACLLPPEAILDALPALTLGDSLCFYLRQGQAVFVPHAPTSGWVRVHDKGGMLIGVGEIQDDGKVAPRRMFKPHSGKGGADTVFLVPSAAES
ncbi:MAG TPA: tRNA pseudouridine(55) synthase TruB [Methylococcaceae bacterium]|nr:tRNA pseudouridine(55) synthase TruB [Methylococcaceae bacterium]